MTTGARGASAQIVNVQPLLAGDAGEGPSGAVEASGDWRGGNTDLLLVAGSVIGQYKGERHVVFLLARGEYGENAGERFVGKHLEHLRYRFSLIGPLQLEAFAQHDADEFRDRKSVV